MTAKSDRSQFSAKFDPIQAIGAAPNSDSIVRVRDVIVCPTLETDTSIEEFAAHPPIDSPASLRLRADAAKPIDIGRGIALGRLSDEDAKLVMNACSPRGHFFAPIRQFGQRFSFIREVALDEWKERPSAWDPDGTLVDALMISRLIRDNGYSTQFAARIADYENGEQTVAYTLSGAKSAYRLRKSRDWPDPDEGGALRDLLAAFWAVGDTLPDRVRRAVWRTEYSAWVAWADLALPVVVGGLESLLKTERHGATAQFKARVPALAAELGFEAITAELCERMYDARSDWVHGTHVRLFSTGHEAANVEDPPEGPDDAEQWKAVADIARMQDVLRRAVRRCVEEDAFRATFSDDDAVRAHWSV